MRLAGCDQSHHYLDSFRRITTAGEPSLNWNSGPCLLPYFGLHPYLAYLLTYHLAFPCLGCPCLSSCHPYLNFQLLNLYLPWPLARILPSGLVAAIVEVSIKIHQSQRSRVGLLLAFIHVLAILGCHLDLSPCYLRLRTYRLLNGGFVGTFGRDFIYWWSARSY